jgi:hypothetical protein
VKGGVLQIKISHRGSFKNMEAFGQRVKARSYLTPVLSKYGQIGVTALSGATPIDSGLAASSWYYEIVDKPGYFAIHWYNSDVENGYPVAIALQYGHATGNGGYVHGRDYINPVMRPIFDQMVADMWREVTK